MKTKLLKLADDMYQINRQISFKNIAMKKPMTEYDIIVINRFIGKWIKELRNIAEDSNGNV
jgi:hypothetical protein